MIGFERCIDEALEASVPFWTDSELLVAVFDDGPRFALRWMEGFSALGAGLGCIVDPGDVVFDGSLFSALHVWCVESGVAHQAASRSCAAVVGGHVVVAAEGLLVELSPGFRSWCWDGSEVGLDSLVDLWDMWATGRG